MINWIHDNGMRGKIYIHVIFRLGVHIVRNMDNQTYIVTYIQGSKLIKIINDNPKCDGRQPKGQFFSHEMVPSQRIYQKLQKDNLQCHYRYVMTCNGLFQMTYIAFETLKVTEIVTSLQQKICSFHLPYLCSHIIFYFSTYFFLTHHRWYTHLYLHSFQITIFLYLEFR